MVLPLNRSLLTSLLLSKGVCGQNAWKLRPVGLLLTGGYTPWTNGGEEGGAKDWWLRGKNGNEEVVQQDSGKQKDPQQLQKCRVGEAEKWPQGIQARFRTTALTSPKL